MADFVMPTLGADMTSGTLVAWKVKPGDAVKRGQLIATVETVKGAIDVEVWVDGVVEELLTPVGASVPVGAVLARLRPAAEPTKPQPPATPSVSGTTPAPATHAGSATPGSEPNTTASSPAPFSHAQPVPSPQWGEGQGEGSIHTRGRATPVARRMAAELGIDLSTVRGTGPEGAVTRADLEALAPTKLSPAVARAPTPAPTMRSVIGAAMSRSKREIPHYYLATDIDLAPALAWLERQNATRSVADRVLPAALLLQAASRALLEVPGFNGTWVHDAFAPCSAVHLGVAIHLRTGGLVAPAIRDAHSLTLAALMAKLSDLVARARGGGLTSSELTSGTITVTNLGDTGVSSVFPVIFPPQVAMIGFGRVVPRPWVVDGAVVARPIVTASLAADHRVSDGHAGARLLSAVDRLLQHPEAL